MINEYINRKILAVWQKYFGDDEAELAPIFYDDFKEGGIVFVGMNPSNTSRGKKKLHLGTEFEQTGSDFLLWSGVKDNPAQVDAHIRSGRNVIEGYPFFRRMRDTAKACQTHFQHLDLFLYRQTKQKDFLRLVQNEDGRLNDFGRSQLEIFRESLETIRPDVIVISNAGAGDIFREYFKDDLSPFDNENGFHWLMLNGSRVPTFFSSMLSGQRALDTGSYERLKWHVRRAAEAA